MKAEELARYDGLGLAELARRREVSAAELLDASIARVEALNPEINAVVTRLYDQARAAIAAGLPAGPFTGVPYLLKDLGAHYAGAVTSYGSALFKDFVVDHDSEITARLKRAGLVIFGKTNTPEMGLASSTEPRLFGPTRNPWNLAHSAGGSSGGSAAVVAQGTAVVSLGSDTGGSIRQPASFCGVVGVTPTYGRVSRYGLTAFASSLDHIGPFARSVKDAATVLRVISGRDVRDSTSAEAPVPDYSAHLTRDVKGLKLGLPVEYLKHLTSETGDLIARGVEQLKSLGCEVREISLPATEYAIACYYIIATAEASSNLARYDGVRYTFRSPASDTLSDMYRNTRGEGFGAECKRRIMLGTYVLSAGYYDAYYLKAQKVRTLIARDFAKAFQEVDAIVAPVSPFPAFKLGEKVDDPLAMYLSDIFTITGSLAGIPCMSVPCGNTAEGLPVGMQILTKHFDETTMFRIADAFENVQRKE